MMAKGGMESNHGRVSGKKSGFTLVEMAVVLAVIGLILGAVMIGQDVLRQGEYVKIRQKFIDQWKLAYDSYFNKTGVPVGDDPTKPQMIVNGRNFGGTTGGDMSGASVSPYCAQTSSSHRINSGSSPDTGLRDDIVKQGISLPPGRGEGSEDRYIYQDTNGNPQEIQVCFGWFPPGTNSGSGNVMIIAGLTPDLARYLDEAIDGQADPEQGRFRQWQGQVSSEASSGATGQGNSGNTWRGDNTQNYNDSTQDSSNAINPTAADEQQVQTVEAHYKMSR